MNALLSLRRKARQFSAGLLALPLVFVLSSGPVHAAELPAASSAVPAQPSTQPAQKSARKHRTHQSRRPHHHASASRARKARTAFSAPSGELALKSNAALVIDQDSGETLAVKNPDVVMPIASITKLMTALVVLDAKLPMDEVLEISSDDIDRERNTHSRLSVGTELTRRQMLLLALMSSENRAAMALSRNYPGGRTAFVEQMNLKAKELGMASTHFADPAGLLNGSVSTARDLHRLVSAAYQQPLIRSDTTQPQSTVRVKRRTLTFINSNSLVRGTNDWDVELQKTGFTNEAGRCLVMQVSLAGRRLAMIFLDSVGKMTRYADAARVRQRLELDAKTARPRMTASASGASP